MDPLTYFLWNGMLYVLRQIPLTDLLICRTTNLDNLDNHETVMTKQKPHFSSMKTQCLPQGQCKFYEDEHSF